MLTASTFEFIETIDEQQDSTSLVAAFQRLIRQFGLSYFVVGDPAPPSSKRHCLWATTQPSRWLQRWTSRNYHEIGHRSGTAPQEPTASLEHERRRRRQTGTRILEEAGEFQMNAGYAFRSSMAMASVVVRWRPITMDRQEGRNLPAFAAVYFHAGSSGFVRAACGFRG